MPTLPAAFTINPVTELVATWNSPEGVVVPTPTSRMVVDEYISVLFTIQSLSLAEVR